MDAERGERIKYVRTEVMHIKSQEKFAEVLTRHGKQSTRGAVGNWELGKEISLESLTSIARVSGVDLEWLAYNKGSGPVIKTVAPTGITSALVRSYDPDEGDDQPREETASYSREHWKPAVDGALPEVDVKLGAGSGVVGETINISVGRESFSGHAVVAEWLIPLQYLRNEAKASPNHTLVMEVIGDSMLPTYMPGDRVLVDLSQTTMSSDTVYAISDGQSEPQIKRLQRVPFSDPVEVRIISDNPNLERFTVELERLTILGRIVGHIARK
ncbi:S24 family peptidase [Agrobacterium vaccinii]|uniref:S24 family peptidase n=1 Tax=Agrobacterium vaccinii TaxID=2735528 RepID=UPI003BAEBA29